MLLLNSSWSYGARAAVEQLQEVNRIVVVHATDKAITAQAAALGAAQAAENAPQSG
jgi:hypothetical protein